MTGGRLRRLAPLLKYETFMCTYGDGVSNIDIDKLIEFHRGHGKLVTMTVARPSARFGVVETDASQPGQGLSGETGRQRRLGQCRLLRDGAGFLKYIDGDASVLEREPLERAAKDGQLMAYYHHEFWKCMDMKKDVA